MTDYFCVCKAWHTFHEFKSVWLTVSGPVSHPIMLADTEWATCEPWSIVYAAVPTEHSKLLWAVGRIVRDYMCLRGLAQDGTVLVVTHNDWVTNWQGVLVWACPYFLTLAGTHMVSIEQERMSCKLRAWPSGQTGRFKDESATWTLGRCLFWPVSRREVGLDCVRCSKRVRRRRQLYRMFCQIQLCKILEDE